MNTWIVVGGNAGIENLVIRARSLGVPATAIVLGGRDVADAVAASGVDAVRWVEVSDAMPVEAYAPWLGDLAAAEGPAVVLGSSRATDRVLLGAIAARTGAPVLTMVSDVTADAEPQATHALYGGIAQRTIAAKSMIVAMEGGSAAASGASVAVEPLAGTALPGFTITEVHPAEHERVDLSRARRVVAVGRGCKTRGQLAGVEELARLLDAEVACSRPVAEGLDWMPHDRYIGVTGQRVAPDLYLALGISGQLQHVVGARAAANVVVINIDANAPYFAECDSGVVGDMATLVPALIEALR